MTRKSILTNCHLPKLGVCPPLGTLRQGICHSWWFHFKGWLPCPWERHFWVVENLHFKETKDLQLQICWSKYSEKKAVRSLESKRSLYKEWECYGHLGQSPFCLPSENLNIVFLWSFTSQFQDSLQSLPTTHQLGCGSKHPSEYQLPTCPIYGRIVHCAG